MKYWVKRFFLNLFIGVMVLILGSGVYASTESNSQTKIPVKLNSKFKTTVKLSLDHNSEHGDISSTQKQLNETGVVQNMAIEREIGPYIQVGVGVGIRSGKQEFGDTSVEKDGTTDATLMLKATVPVKPNTSIFVGFVGKKSPEDREVTMKFNATRPTQPTPISMNAVSGGDSMALFTGAQVRTGSSIYVARIFKSVWVGDRETEVTVVGAPMNIPKSKILEEGEDITDLNLSYVRLMIPFKLAVGLGYRNVGQVNRIEPTKSLYSSAMEFINFELTPSLHTSERAEWVMPIKYSHLSNDDAVYKGFRIDNGEIYSVGIGINYKL